MKGVETITVSKNEILAGLNKPEDYILAVVEISFHGEKAEAAEPVYIIRPFRREPDFAAVSVGTELEFVIMVIAVSCVKLLSAHNSTQHTSRKHKV
jgi:hypothetical protein